MAHFHDPDETRRVAVAAHQVVTYSRSAGEEVVSLLSGGPGLVIAKRVSEHQMLMWRTGRRRPARNSLADQRTPKRQNRGPR